MKRGSVDALLSLVLDVVAILDVESKNVILLQIYHYIINVALVDKKVKTTNKYFITATT